MAERETFVPQTYDWGSEADSVNYASEVPASEWRRKLSGAPSVALCQEGLRQCQQLALSNVKFPKILAFEPREAHG